MGFSRVESFDFRPGRIIAGKYEVVSLLGHGWEAEVYKLREISTGIIRAGKFFFPQRNLKNKTLNLYAKKLHKLRECSLLIQYHTQETIRFQSETISFLVSEYVEGQSLKEFIGDQKGKRLSDYQALHLLHALAKGMEPIHLKRQYHGDLHPGNIIVRSYGLKFDLKAYDFFNWNASSSELIFQDVIDMIHIFHGAIGGKDRYPKCSQAVKDICCGLKKSLIGKKFKSAGKLRVYLENLKIE